MRRAGTRVSTLHITAVTVLAWIGAARASAAPTTMPAAAEAALREAQDHFTYHGKPIHSGMVNQFVGWLSDGGPVTLAVDVRAGSGTDQYSDRDITQTNGSVKFSLSGEGWQGAWFAYERVGALSDRTQVLHTMSCGGGTGVFESVMFVRFRLQPHTIADAAADFRLVMEVVSDHPLGDRDGGKLAVVGDHAIVGKSRYRKTDVILRPTP